MASIASTCRASARVAARQLRNQSNARGFRTSSAALAAQNFTMPALSPTMTEGNITSWKVKEGDSFIAGDVLLEVETDKATMDVEAQDDGLMAKIITSDGAKGIPVGQRIAVLAESGDDLSSLEIPAEEPVEKKSAPKEESKSAPEPSKSSSSESKPSESKPSEAKSKPPGKGQKQKTVLPSVEILLHKHNLKAEDIPSTGPTGRLLKGDVLAYLNEISSSAPSEIASKIAKLSHLDLSNIKPAAKPAPAKAAAPQETAPEPAVSLNVPVSLAAVLQVQKRMQDSLGITLPLSTFIARAIALANEDLPFTTKSPTANDLFNSVLGLDNIHGTKTKNGAFAPQIVALPDLSGLRMTASKKADLFDDIVGIVKGKSAPKQVKTAVVGAENVFRLSVEREEEKRAKVFLERVKIVLEAEPARLVL